MLVSLKSINSSRYLKTPSHFSFKAFIFLNALIQIKHIIDRLLMYIAMTTVGFLKRERERERGLNRRIVDGKWWQKVWEKNIQCSMKILLHYRLDEGCVVYQLAIFQLQYSENPAESV